MISENKYYVYIMTNPNNVVLYTGVTNDLVKRVSQHKEKITDCFTKKYNAIKLVYYEEFSEINEAIVREKQIKGGSRKKKVDLIESINHEWNDLSETL